MKIDTYKNILLSFAYFKDIPDVILQGDFNIMIDSGAFTAFTKGKQILMDDYCRFLSSYGNRAEKYIMLDVLGDVNKTRNNLDIMYDKGYNPMYVSTFSDTNFAEIATICRKYNQNICVSGGTTRKKWTIWRIQNIKRHNPDALIHGLAFVCKEAVSLKIKSCDSSTSSIGGRFGLSKRAQYLLNDMLFMNQYNIKHSDLNNNRGIYGIARFIEFIRFIQRQKEMKRIGIDLFAAISNICECKQYAYLSQANVDYQEFKQLKF
jgi:hypothetical protein